MNLSLRIELATPYTSLSQQAKVLTEDWAARQVYCLNCSNPTMVRLSNNNPVGDLACLQCREEYELKSLSRPFGRKVDDGAYEAMIARLRASTNPNFLFLHYDRASWAVRNLLVIPKHFVVPEVIERRIPLSMTARRKGWTGCRILLDRIPETGRIHLIRNAAVEPRQSVLVAWRRTLFLRGQADKGWLVSVMSCIERIGRNTFTIEDVYMFENQLARQYPGNGHIKAKIRQQLQVLRNQGYLQFTGRGTYRRATSA